MGSPYASHALTASLLLGTSALAISKLQDIFLLGLAWYFLVASHCVCLLMLFVTGPNADVGRLRDLSSWLAGAVGLPLLSAELHLQHTGPGCGWAHAATSVPPVAAWLLGSIANRNRLTELVVLASSLSIGVLGCLHGNAAGVGAAATMLALSGVINVSLADRLGVNRDNLFRVGLSVFNVLVILAALTGWGGGHAEP